MIQKSEVVQILESFGLKKAGLLFHWGFLLRKILYISFSIHEFSVRTHIDKFENQVHLRQIHRMVIIFLDCSLLFKLPVRKQQIHHSFGSNSIHIKALLN